MTTSKYINELERSGDNIQAENRSGEDTSGTRRNLMEEVILVDREGPGDRH